MGVVVPQGANLGVGGTVSWGSSSNLSALATLPTINSTDGTILVILSAMVGSSSILQIAAGLFPGDSAWRGVGWFVPDIGAVPEQYEWTLNSTALQMAPGSTVSLAIYRSAGAWQYSVMDLSSGERLSGGFENAPNVPFASGDQEAFALESYSSNVTVFSSMGSLVLKSLLVDGRQVTGGLYSFNTWDPSHHPLFVVGGLSAPPYIALVNGDNGSVVWRYNSAWESVEPVGSGTFYAGILLLAVGLSAIIVFVALKVGPGRRFPKASERGSSLANPFMRNGSEAFPASFRGTA